MGQRLACAAALLALGWGCGEDVALRRLEIELVGLSSQVELLRIRVGEQQAEASPCSSLSPAEALAFPAVAEAIWRRSEEGERSLQIAETGLMDLRVVAIGEDGRGEVVQLACADVDYWDIERPEVELTLEDQR